MRHLVHPLLRAQISHCVVNLGLILAFTGCAARSSVGESMWLQRHSAVNPQANPRTAEGSYQVVIAEAQFTGSQEEHEQQIQEQYQPDKGDEEEGQSQEINLPEALGVAAEAGQSSATSALPLPKDAPAPRMSSRHVLPNLDFFKRLKSGPASGNSYLLKTLGQGELIKLYVEAWLKGPKLGFVELSNGQTWFIDKSTGKFFPARGPGIIQLSQQEVSLLETLVKQIRREGVKPQQALKNLSRAMSGRYVLSPEMQIALEEIGKKLGYSMDDLGRVLAPHLPPSAAVKVPAKAQEAAQAKFGKSPLRFVKYGGRILLVVGLAMDGYEVYYAENRPKTAATKAGAWALSLAAGGVAAKAAVPLLATGPVGWAGYGLIVVGVSIGGYVVGGAVAESTYEWVFE